jgi:hypothetical protein
MNKEGEGNPIIRCSIQGSRAFKQQPRGPRENPRRLHHPLSRLCLLAPRPQTFLLDDLKPLGTN